MSEFLQPTHILALLVAAVPILILFNLRRIGRGIGASIRKGYRGE